MKKRKGACSCLFIVCFDLLYLAVLSIYIFSFCVFAFKDTN